MKMLLTIPLKRFYYSALNLFFPLRCLICGKDISQYKTMPLCEEHQSKVKLTDKPFCAICSKKLVSEMAVETICNSCRDAKWHFDRSFSATLYTDVMQELVHLYKYRMRHYLAAPFAALMVKFMENYIDPKKIDIAVPVPLHWRRYLYRGFNQAYEMLRRLNRKYSMKVSRGNLRRIRYTTPQVGLPPDERKENILGAFKVINPDEFKGKNILLIDDVFTTGATMDECARVLKEAGALTVTGFTLTQPLVY
jgi:competence protein ComFC